MRNIAKKVIHDHPTSFISMVLLIILSIITSLLPPLALEQIVNHLTDQKEVSLLFALAYLGLIVLSDLFASAQNISITIFGQKLTHGMRSALVQKLNTITTGYLTNHESGAIASVFVNDADIINSLYSEGVVGMIADLFQLIGLLFVVFTRSIGLGFIILIVMPLILVMTRHFQKASLASQKQNRAAIAKVNHHIPETLRVLSMIHIFEKEDYMEDKYDQYIEESYRAQRLDSVYSPIILTIEAVVIGPADDRGRPRAEDADFLWHQCRQRRGLDRLCRADFYTAGINRDGNPKHPRCHGRDEPDPGLFK